MEHELKIWPQYFAAVSTGMKTFELRNNDRAFQAGDIVVLHEWEPMLHEYEDEHPFGSDTIKAPKGFTGKFLRFKIGYVLPVDAERVVFSLVKP